jgi:VanZ family protein
MLFKLRHFTDYLKGETSQSAFLRTLIFATIILGSTPYTRDIQKYLFAISGIGFYVVLFVLLSSALLGFTIKHIYNISKNKSEFKIRLFWLAVVAGVYCVYTWKLRKIPVETVHFIIYGILSYLVFKALRYHLKDVTIYFCAASIVLFVGIVDEIIQWVLPSRVGNLKDIKLNLVAGANPQLWIWKGLRPDYINESVSIRSFKILAIILLLVLISLGGFLLLQQYG